MSGTPSGPPQARAVPIPVCGECGRGEALLLLPALVVHHRHGGRCWLPVSPNHPATRKENKS